MSGVKDIIKQMNALGKLSDPFLFILDFNLYNPVLLRIKNVNPDEIRFNLNGFGNTDEGNFQPKVIVFRKSPISLDIYQQAFERVMKQIGLGNTYLLNLTFQTKIETNLSLSEIFELGQAKYKLYVNNSFVVFSPEAFVKIENNTISSYPMKGTTDAGLPDATNILMHDKKELAEHNTIVDLIRNDLSMVSKNVRVEKFRYIDKIKTHEKELLQTSSKICGDLSSDWKSHIGDILFSMLPAGSISGAPKKRTVELIKETENHDRGYFTGVFGIFDGKKLDSAVMIRFIEKSGSELYFKSGGGITSFSTCESEYREMIDKVYLPMATFREK
jgi:para-aminobenzoate synthetase component 1